MREIERILTILPTADAAGQAWKDYGEVIVCADEDEMVRVVPSPGVIHIVVCGDPNRSRTMVLWGGYVNPITKKMTFPAQ